MQFGPYVLGEVLGRGGTATVYRAADTRSGKDVALKLLHPEVSAQPRVRRRFQTEIQTLTRLRHPNAIRVYDAGLHEGQLWLALELIEGESLQERLSRETTLSVPEAIRVVSCVAEGLAHAHENGVLHRDVKPDNVLLAPGGRVVLTDFGLALDQEQAAEVSRLTRDGMFMGTPGFWAPEQAKGRLAEIGPPTDVYGLGATLYACLIGSAPVQGQNLVAFLRTGAFQAVSRLEHKRPDVPPWLGDVCERCLHADPQQRYADAQALGSALAAGGRSTRQQGRLPGVFALAAALAVCALLAATWLATRSPSVDPSALGPRISPVARIHGELTRALIRARLDREAEATGSVALQAAPDWPAAWAARAFVRARLHDQAGARRDAQRALRLDPACAAAYAARAEAAIDAKDPDSAAPDRDAALRLDPKLPWAHAVDGGVLRLQERFDEAQRAYERAIALDPELAAARSELGFLLAGQGRVEEALEAYARCLELTPHVAEDRRNHGRMLISLDRYDEARRDLDEALRLEPDHPVALSNRGTIAYRQGRSADARRDFERILSRDPEQVIPLTFMGLLSFEQRQYDEALRYYDRALELNPNSGPTHANRATTLKALGRLDASLAGYDRALELQPYDAQAYAGRAQLHLRRGAVRLALEDSERALGIDPNTLGALVPRAMALADLGEFERAIADMERYLSTSSGQATPERANFETMLRRWRKRARR